MKTSSQNGGFVKTLLVFIVALACIFTVIVVFTKYFLPASLFTGSGVTSTSTGTSVIGGLLSDSSYDVRPNPLIDFSGSDYGGSYGSGSLGGETNRSQPNTDGSGRSPYSTKVSFSSGTAGSTYQTFEEYVTISNNSSAPVNITGWVLANGKGSRPVDNTQVHFVYPATDSATIGTGTEFLNPTGMYQTGPIILKPGDMAYVTTGRPYSQYPFPITTSFRDNVCTGYLKNYPFSPALVKQCPYPTDDPLIRTMTDQCYDYLRSIGRCEEPAKEDKDYFDHEVGSQCQQFIRSRYNYAGCVDHTQNQSDFSTRTWRVFLGKDKELWASSRETITLYDSKGLIVNQVSY